MKMKRMLFLFAALLLIVGCSRTNTTMDNSGSSDGTATSDGKVPSKEEIKEETEEKAMLNYFMPDGSKAHYKGEGNEFAELIVTVARPYENYVIIHEDNGGILVRRIYKTEDDAIILLEEKPVNNSSDIPAIKELEGMKQMSTYLKKPFEKGTTFDNWTIIEVDATVETPYKTFNNAIVIEEKDKDIVNRKYIAEEYGEVKREAIMDTEDGEMVVTSTLESVTKE